MNVRATGIDRIRQAEVAGRLKARLPEGAVLFQEEDTRPYECDGLTAYRQLPIVVRAAGERGPVGVGVETLSTTELQQAIARGAGTGLSGGALPSGEGVLLALAKMKRILAVDPVARIARVQPGVRNLAVISEAAEPYGRTTPPTRPANARAPSAATWPRTLAGRTASSTGSPTHNRTCACARFDDRTATCSSSGREAPDRAGLRSPRPGDRQRRQRSAVITRGHGAAGSGAPGRARDAARGLCRACAQAGRRV